MSNGQSIRELLRAAAARFQASNSPMLDAQVLLGHVLGQQRSRLIAWPEKAVSDSHAGAFEKLVERRADGEPVAYLTGTREFWSLEFAVTPDTLVPRPDTEILVARALELAPPGARLRIADLGTGSGAIAVAIASERPAAEITATDISAPALDVARGNAHRHGVEQIRFVCGNWLTPLAGERYDLIVSNPPYVESSHKCLADGDTAHEPRAALSAGADGLDALRQLVDTAPAHIANGGALLLEHGASQAQALEVLLRDAGLDNIHTHHDLAGLPRCTEARRHD